MFQGRSLQDLAAVITELAKRKRDFVADTRSIRMVPGENPDIAETRLAVEGHGHFGVNRWAHGQFSSYTAVPRQYYDRLLHSDPQLLCDNVNHWLDAKPDNRLVRTIDTTCRALLSDRYRIIDNEDLAEMALPILSEDSSMKIASCEITEQRMYIKALFPRIERDIKPGLGDAVQAGVVISNGEIGNGSIRVEPLIFRLVCLNGMIAPTSVRRRHVGRQLQFEGDVDAQEIYRDDTRAADDRALMLKLRDTIRAAMDEARFNKWVDEMAAATEDKITAPNPVKVIERCQHKFRWDEAETGAVLTYLIEGHDLSRFGLLNAITRASQDAEDYDRATELERQGGELLVLDRDEWKTLAEAA